MYDTGAKVLSFHSILHMCVQETISDKDRVCQVTQLLLARATPNGITDADYQFRRLLIAHAECIHQNNHSTFLIYDCLGRIFNDAGLWIKAASISQKALVYCEHYFGKCHPDTLTSMSNLAWINKQYGRLEEAKVLEKETLKLSKEVLGERHPDTLISMSNLAWTYKQYGQLKKAEVLETETLKLRKEVLGEHHPHTLASMSNLALTYKQYGRLEEAEMLGKETYKLCKEVLGECHP